MKFWRKLFHFIFIRDFLAKVVCVFLGVFFWYYATVLSIEKTYINLPIEILNAPDNMAIEFQQEKNVRVELQAREDISSYIGRIQATVDLEEAKKGKKQFPIRLQNLPAGIHYDLSPRNLSISLEDIVSNTVPIVLEVRSNAQKEVNKYTINPDKITIIGSAARIKQISSIKTDPLNLDNLGAMRIFSTNIKLRLPNNVSISPNISVISIEGQIDNYTITNKVFLPATVENLKPSLVIPITPNIEFNVLTASSNIERLILNTKVTANFAKVTNAGSHSVPIKIEAPEGLRLINAPTNMSILIESDPELSSEKADLPIPLDTLEEMERDLDIIEEDEIQTTPNTNLS
ncbi:MAG: CdaR family protein [Brevinema sp.]